MKSLNFRQLGLHLREKRGEDGIRVTATEIGISPATLSRVERGNLPDLETFAKICRWLEVDPAEVLDVDVSRSTQTDQEDVIADVHLRADQTWSEELSGALADLIVAAKTRLRGYGQI